LPRAVRLAMDERLDAAQEARLVAGAARERVQPVLGGTRIGGSLARGLVRRGVHALRLRIGAGCRLRLATPLSSCRVGGASRGGCMAVVASLTLRRSRQPVHEFMQVEESVAISIGGEE